MKIWFLFGKRHMSETGERISSRENRKLIHYNPSVARQSCASKTKKRIKNNPYDTKTKNNTEKKTAYNRNPFPAGVARERSKINEEDRFERKLTTASNNNALRKNRQNIYKIIHTRNFPFVYEGCRI